MSSVERESSFTPSSTPPSPSLSSGSNENSTWVGKFWGFVKTSPYLALPRSVFLWSVWTVCRLQSKYQILQKRWQQTIAKPTDQESDPLSRNGNGDKKWKGGAEVQCTTLHTLPSVDVSSRFHISIGSSYSGTLQNYRREDIRQLVTQMLATSSDTGVVVGGGGSIGAGGNGDSLLSSSASGMTFPRFYLDYLRPSLDDAVSTRVTRVFHDPHVLLCHISQDEQEPPTRITTATTTTPLCSSFSSSTPQIFMVMYYARRLCDSPNEIPTRIWWTKQDAAYYVHEGNHLFAREMVFEMLQRQFRTTAPDKVTELWRPDEYELQVFLSDGVQCYLTKTEYLEVRRGGGGGGHVVNPNSLTFVKCSQTPPQENRDRLPSDISLEQIE